MLLWAQRKEAVVLLARSHIDSARARVDENPALDPAGPRGRSVARWGPAAACLALLCALAVAHWFPRADREVRPTLA